MHANWSSFFWMDLYYRDKKGSPSAVRTVTRNDFPLGMQVSSEMMAILNEAPPRRTELGLRCGKIKELLWNEDALMFEARCERGVVYGRATETDVVLMSTRAEGTWTTVERRALMQGTLPRKITVDEVTYDFARPNKRAVYGGWLKHERLFFLTKSKDGIQFERVFKGDHSILRPRYQPTHIIITDHHVLYFFQEKGGRVLFFRYR